MSPDRMKTLLPSSAVRSSGSSSKASAHFQNLSRIFFQDESSLRNKAHVDAPAEKQPWKNKSMVSSVSAAVGSHV